MVGIDDATFPTYANPLASARTAKGIAAARTGFCGAAFGSAVSYEQTWFEGGAGTAATAMDAGDDHGPADRVRLHGRAQVNF